MLRQMINGRIVQTVMVSGSEADLTTLAHELVGQTHIYDKKAEGGSMSEVIASPNSIGFSVGKKYIDGSRASAFIRIPHLKVGKSFADVKTAVLGAWDASVYTAEACEYVNEIGNSSRG